MRYENILEAVFISRKNRFIAEVLINGKIELCHVKNTGRCKELLVKSATVFVQENFNQNRKTKYSLICVNKQGRIINMDSQVPNLVVFEALSVRGNKILPFIYDEITHLKREVTFGNSRFDIYFETGTKKGFIEIKGVTLESGNIAKFPDAPTTRGIKHINELLKAREDGFETYIFFVIQMKDVLYFTPNKDTHLDFYNKVKEAYEKGINVLAYDCFVNENTISLGEDVPIKF